MMLAVLLGASVVSAQEHRIAVIIDDVGHALAAGRRVVALPGPVVVAILPYTPYARALAHEAAARGKEILLHMPMQASDLAADPGPGALELLHDADVIGSALESAFAAVPHAIGVNNHMGSLVMRDPPTMRTFMRLLAARDVRIFVDSYTTHLSVGLMLAREQGIPALKRDVFLDADPGAGELDAAWRRLLARARSTGFAVAIAHPHAPTLDFLESRMTALVDVRMVSLQELLSDAHTQRSYAEMIGQAPIGDFLTSERMH